MAATIRADPRLRLGRMRPDAAGDRDDPRDPATGRGACALRAAPPDAGGRARRPRRAPLVGALGPARRPALHAGDPPPPVREPRRRAGPRRGLRDPARTLAAH